MAFLDGPLYWFGMACFFGSREGHKDGSCKKLLEDSHRVWQSQWLMALKMDMLLAKTGPMREVGNASDDIFKKEIKTKSQDFASREEEEKKGLKEDLRNYRHVNLTLVPRNVMKHHLEDHYVTCRDHQLIKSSQFGFMKGRPYLIDLISFYDKVTHLVDKGKAVDVVYLNFSKDFDIISHSILLEKLFMTWTGVLFTG
ncbi:hypothetical protein TURU_002529 [Turdus rufiventris]|nr:hypothetical protein TURU_002529 [Turdus rufiventris]